MRTVWRLRGVPIDSSSPSAAGTSPSRLPISAHSTGMVETRALRRQSMGVPAKQAGASPGSKNGTGTKGTKAIKDLDAHWSGAKKGGARGSGLLANAVSTGGVIAIIATTPFIAVIVYVIARVPRTTDSHTPARKMSCLPFSIGAFVFSTSATSARSGKEMPPARRPLAHALVPSRSASSLPWVDP